MLQEPGGARQPTKHVRLSGITRKPYVLPLPLTPTRLADGLGLGSALLHCTCGDAPRVAHGVLQSVPPYLPTARGRFRLTICTGIQAKKIPETAVDVNSHTRGQPRGGKRATIAPSLGAARGSSMTEVERRSL